MSEFAWGTLASVGAVMIGAVLQYAVSRRTSTSSDRHVNFEEASEIIARLSDEIVRKDTRIVELEHQIHECNERCRACEHRERQAKP